MNAIALAIILLPLVGLIAGVGLGVAAHFMSVKENERALALREVLPGANCGACGFSGCSGYAEALANSPNIKTNLCPVGGDDVAVKISEILGVEASATVPMRAIVRCAGSIDASKRAAEYVGVASCRAAAALYNGGNACRYGCIGLGDCAAVCEMDAIDIRRGVAVVDHGKCLGCGKCAAVCPKSVISVVPAGARPYVACHNPDKGPQTKKVCSVGCVGCRMCLKACEAGAISFDGFRAKIDPQKCTACGKCVEACKFGVIKVPSAEA
jgi:RnfABCDGE-type electron transport complex B subunit